MRFKLWQNKPILLINPIGSESNVNFLLLLLGLKTIAPWKSSGALWLIRKIKTQNKTSAEKVRENSIGWLLKSLAAKLDKQMKQDLEALGLNLGRFAMMITLLENDGMTQTEIGKKVSMPDYATTRKLMC